MGNTTHWPLKIYEKIHLSVCLNFTLCCVVYGKVEFVYFLFIWNRMKSAKISNCNWPAPRTINVIFWGVVIIMTPVWGAEPPSPNSNYTKFTFNLSTLLWLPLYLGNYIYPWVNHFHQIVDFLIIANFWANIFFASNSMV